jgi:hypothetical protein
LGQLFLVEIELLFLLLVERHAGTARRRSEGRRPVRGAPPGPK